MIGRYDTIKQRFGAAELLVLAQTEGLHHRASGRRRSECPGCRNSDARGASIGERNGVGVWHCFRDESHAGSAIDFLALARSISVRDAADELERQTGGAGYTAPRRIAEPEPTYPPQHEVAEVWAAARVLTDHPEVAKGWTERGIDVDVVAQRDLARALPFGVRLPRWAWGAGSVWSEGAYRLLVPMYDAAGQLVTLHARMARAPKGKPKGLSPAGYAVAGTVMADAAGLALLRDTSESTHILIAEGVPDFLSWATRWSTTAPAIFSVISGGWSNAMATHVPAGSRVLIATHADAAGEKYATKIASTLRGRCRLLRGQAEAA